MPIPEGGVGMSSINDNSPVKITLEIRDSYTLISHLQDVIVMHSFRECEDKS